MPQQKRAKLDTHRHTGHTKRALVWGAIALVILVLCVAFAWSLLNRFASVSLPMSLVRPDSRHPESNVLPPFQPQCADALYRTIGDTKTEVTAVNRSAFHIVIADENGTGPASPFVIETTPWSAARIEHGAGIDQIRTPTANLSITNESIITLHDAFGRRLLWNGTVNRFRRGMQISFTHAKARFYGSGNSDLGVSGPLVHTSGVSAVGNGFTRIPFIWTPAGYGLLLANNRSGISWTDTGTRLTWTIPSHFIDLYVMVAPNLYALLDTYTQITGRPPVPPAWTFGYLQSRWGYANAADVREKWYRFKSLHIPIDAFIYDYDWFTDDWKFNPSMFPHPAANLAEMHKLGLHFVGIRKPRVNGEHLRYAQQNGWTLIAADLRFDLPYVQHWWSEHQVPLIQTGIDGWWNDQAEASYDEYFYMNLAERARWITVTSKQFWSINRAFTPGMQRFGASVWTGDIPSTWKSLQNQPGTMLNWSLCGMTYVGQDIGGFRGTPSPELYIRWMQEGALTPIMRAHGILGSHRWPWSFGTQALDAARKAILLHYQLRPYFENCAREASSTGAPIIRPLFFEFPNDPAVFNMDHEWLIGRDLLAAPVLYPGGRSNIYLPRGEWREFGSRKVLSGPRWLHRTLGIETIPLYVRLPESKHFVKLGL